MSKIVIFGIKNETGLWMADIDAGTVVPYGVDKAAFLQATKRDGQAEPALKGLDVAAAVDMPEQAFAGVVDVAPANKNGLDVAVAVDMPEQAFASVVDVAPAM